MSQSHSPKSAEWVHLNVYRGREANSRLGSANMIGATGMIPSGMVYVMIYLCELFAKVGDGMKG
jgi:hypothetical protein